MFPRTNCGLLNKTVNRVTDKKINILFKYKYLANASITFLYDFLYKNETFSLIDIWSFF